MSLKDVVSAAENVFASFERKTLAEYSEMEAKGRTEVEELKKHFEVAISDAIAATHKAHSECEEAMNAMTKIGPMAQMDLRNLETRVEYLKHMMKGLAHRDLSAIMSAYTWLKAEL